MSAMSELAVKLGTEGAELSDAEYRLLADAPDAIYHALSGHYRPRLVAIEAERRKALDGINARYHAELGALEREYGDRRRAIEARRNAEAAPIALPFVARLNALSAEWDARVDAVRRRRWEPRPRPAALVLTEGHGPEPCGCASCVERRLGVLTPTESIAAGRYFDPPDDDHECGGSCAEVMRGRACPHEEHEPSPVHSVSDC